MLSVDQRHHVSYSCENEHMSHVVMLILRFKPGRFILVHTPTVQRAIFSLFDWIFVAQNLILLYFDYSWQYSLGSDWVNGWP